MKEILKHIDSLKAALSKLQPVSDENQQKLDKKLRLEWNYNSNHIEGNTLTYGETELLLIFGETKGNHEFREYEEMKGHDVALKLVEDLACDTERTLSENFIRELNKVILKEPFYKEAITPDGQPTRRLIKIGEYKSFSNHVQLSTGEMFYYSSPEETPVKMFDLMNWYNETSRNSSLHPIEIAAELHYRFVCIHPFDDGNGRISRLIMNYHLLKNNYPPVIIKSADKKNYLFALHEADTGNLEAFKTYIAEQLVWSYEISIKAAKGESIDEPEDLAKEIELLKKQLNKKEEIKQSKSYDIILKRWESSLLPFLNELNERLENFDSLFVEKKITYHLNETELLTSVLGKKLHEGFEIIGNAITESQKDISSLRKLDASYKWNSFKKNGTDSFNLYLNIEITFLNFKYTITVSPYDIKPIDLLYHQDISTIDKSNLLKIIGELLLNDIKLRTKIP